MLELIVVFVFVAVGWFIAGPVGLLVGLVVGAIVASGGKA